MKCSCVSDVPAAPGDRAGDGRVYGRGPALRSHGGVQQAQGPRLHPAGREEPRVLHGHVLRARHSELAPQRKYSFSDVEADGVQRLNNFRLKICST